MKAATQSMLMAAAIAAAGVGIAVASGFLFCSQKVDWQPVPGSRAHYAAFAGWDAGILPAALSEAERELRLHTDTDVARLEPMLVVAVHRGSSWTDAYGRRVGGETYGTGVEVEESLGSLLHEMRHAAEIQQKGGADSEHATWADAGVWDADREFRAWLQLRQSTSIDQ